MKYSPGTSVLLLAIIAPAFSQVPQINSGGVANAASYAAPVAPGSLAVLFGSNLATTTASAGGFPWPPTLGGASVTVNGIPAPLFYVSPAQINFQIPSAAAYLSSGYVPNNVVVTTPGGSSQPVPVSVNAVGPAIFTANSSGCGQAALLNITPEGKITLNSPSNTAAPGDYLVIFGTGFGLVRNEPPDGSPAGGLTSFPQMPQLTLNGIDVSSSITYAGRAPSLPGVDQLNILIPSDAPQGCAVPLQALGTADSPPVTVSIHSGRGQCVGPAMQAYGEILLTRTITAGTGNDGETDTLTATFPSGPGLQAPPNPAPQFGGYLANETVLISPQPNCAIPGREDLPAGTIQVQGPSGPAVPVQPTSETGGTSYNGALPAGFIAPGVYTVSSAGGPGVGAFQASITAGGPIQVQTPLPAGTAISSSAPFTVAWTGGDPGSVVTIRLISGQGLFNQFDVAYAHAEDQSFTFVPLVSGIYQSLGISPSNDAQVIVEVSPAAATPFSAPMLTLGGEASWLYRYVFGGLGIE